MIEYTFNLENPINRYSYSCFAAATIEVSAYVVTTYIVDI